MGTLKGMDAPPRLLRKQAEALFSDTVERDRFVKALMDAAAREQAIVVLRETPALREIPSIPPVSWQPSFVRRVPESFRPGKHWLHDEGAYYILDFSSVFAASPLLVIPRERGTEFRVLDLCAAPGGKSIFANKALTPTLLVANETIRKRTGVLIENLRRCRVQTSHVWSADPAVWGDRYPEEFDLVIVDAPCTGQSLLAKGMDAVGCFSPQMIDMNVGRQRRIIGNAARCVRPGGWMLYCTCTFSRKENEKVIEWLIGQAPEFEAVEVPFLKEFRTQHSKLPAYRLFPHQGLGAGAFTCLLRHTGQPPEHRSALEVHSTWSYAGEQAERAAQVQGGSQG